MPHPRPAARHLLATCRGRAPVRGISTVLVVMLGAVLTLAGCDEKKKERPQTQVAARVDGHAITLPQINLVLEQQPHLHLRPEQSDAASRQVLARLVEQRLLLDQAERLDLEHEPRVAERLAAARREILARAYAERVGEKATSPTPQQVAQYYERHPELFAKRRIYSIQELAIEARPEQRAALAAQLKAATSLQAFITQVQSEGYRFAGNQAVRAAEQLAPPALRALAAMQPGQAMMGPLAAGVLVTTLVSARSEPLTLAQAQGFIEQQLLAEHKRQLLETEIAALRKAARIEYAERFAPGPAASAASAVSAESAESAGLAASVGSAGSAVDAVDASQTRAPTLAPAASMAAANPR